MRRAAYLPHCRTPYDLWRYGRAQRCLSSAARRKNRVLAMAYRAPDDPCKVVATEKINYKGKPSSDVTKGFEKIYERSYY